MGLLISSLWSRLWSSRTYKIVIVGLNNAGKTTTLFKLHLGEAVDTTPTIGSNVEAVTHNNVQFQVWDLGGQESLRASWSMYYADTHAIIMVVDSTDVRRMDIVKQELFKLLAHQDLASTIILVLANKQDVKGHLTSAEVATALDLVSIKTHHWHIQPCTATTGEGLYEGMDWLTQKVKG